MYEFTTVFRWGSHNAGRQARLEAAERNERRL